jgi:hypothetical protein
LDITSALNEVGEANLGERGVRRRTTSEPFNACYENRPLRSGGGEYDGLSEARE